MSVRHILIAVPARDEELTLGACVRSLARARALVDVPSTVVVVLDSCTDDSAGVLRRFPDVLVLEREHGNVGRSRADAVAAGLAAIRIPEVRQEEIWLAFTDADGTVPPGWLREHLTAERAADAYVGAVVPRLADLDASRRHAWHRSHGPGATVGHVHGANLGVRASAYTAVGGFPPLPVGEDVELVARLRADGFRVVADDAEPVRTSSRLIGRAPDGYARYLRDLTA
ncbi:glycosyltransferase [Leifsonia sp. NPDC080035]|uniref:4,4'-diaponeurosporenoate glycosyltransferase n=1 Tax=Leifsonia sp. NPDC080035 TaxID=3143936 RepID=A0AAU7GBB5_9MICO